jgi:hypothetical protein
VPTCTPSAPNASAAATPRRSAMPPAATTGIDTASTQRRHSVDTASTRRRHGVEHLRDERERADQRLADRTQECAAVPAGVAAGGDYQVQSGRLHRDRFVHGRRGADQPDAVAVLLVDEGPRR